MNSYHSFFFFPTSWLCLVHVHLREKGGEKKKENTIPAKCEIHCNTSFISTLLTMWKSAPPPWHHLSRPPSPPLLGSHSFSLSKHFASCCHNREFHPPSKGGRRKGIAEGQNPFHLKEEQNFEIFERTIILSWWLPNRTCMRLLKFHLSISYIISVYLSSISILPPIINQSIHLSIYQS